jgi:hypothetical protein
MMKKYTAVKPPTAKLRIQKSWLMRTENGGVIFTSTGGTFGLAVGGRTGASRAGGAGVAALATTPEAGPGGDCGVD